MPTSNRSGDRSPNSLSLLGVSKIVALLVLLGAGLTLWWPRTGEGPRSSKTTDLSADYIGSRSCRGCHTAEHLEYSSSGHSKTLQSAASTELARLLDGRRTVDPEKPGVTWTYALDESRFSVSREADGDRNAIAIDFALGSGKHATTFVTLAQGETGRRAGLEHRLTYYAATKSLGLTPGQHEFSKVGQSDYGFILPPGQIQDCFNCHATLTSARRPDVLDPATMIPNVSCERCHGPGRAHVAKAKADAPASELVMPAGPGRMNAAEEVRACGGCHRRPGNLQPSEIRPDNFVLARFPSVGLIQSKCYKDSKGELRCTTCHDPHTSVSNNANQYNHTCRSCHEGPTQRTCTVTTSPRDACTTCHMPGRDVGHGLTLTDHWIRTNAGGTR